MSRIEKERETLKKMISIYCWKKHGQERGKLCSECRELLEYALKRLSLCPFGEEKPTCKKCTVHCYSPEMREKIKKVMRFSGPRLLIYDPLSWLIHEVKEKLSFKQIGL